MPTRETAPTGAPCWVDLSTPDPAASRAFYGRLFGWTASEPQEQFGGYTNFLRDDVPVAGLMQAMPDQPVPAAWSVYLATDDAQKTVEAAADAGAHVITPSMPVGDLGSMALLVGPDGAAIGAWQAGTFAGTTVLGEPGTPSWFELHTRDYASALDFYRGVFRWETEVASDVPEFRYTTAKDPSGQDVAGVMDATAFLPDGAPAQWSVYFGVDDADAASALVVELGGSVLAAAEDTPYGRLATVADPAGAVFKLVAPNDAMPAR